MNPPTNRPETPDQVHGRLMEAVHISGYTLERACGELKWLLQEDRWRAVGGGVEDFNAFVATLNFAHFKLVVEQRQELAALLTEAGASQRATAKALGVGKTTVVRDVAGPNGPSEDVEPIKNEGTDADAGPSGPPDPDAWFQDTDADPTRPAKAKATREAKRVEVTERLNSVESLEGRKTAGVADVVVIDPPWPMEKIERDVAPNQVRFEYPTMTVEAIGSYIEQRKPFADNCHVWLWTTHRFLPDALALLVRWRLKYVCTFTWHKAGGFQPVGLPQYNSEFALYARCGAPQFTDTKAFPTCFTGGRIGHSAKPDEFYALVRRVTAGRRLDLFNRREIEGFEGEGNEAPE